MRRAATRAALRATIIQGGDVSDRGRRGCRIPRAHPTLRWRTRRWLTTDLLEQAADDQADGEEPETGPLRRCIITRERLPKERMIRFVVGPDRMLIPDLGATLPGRGIWLSASADVIEPVRAKGNLVRLFARAARGPVTMPPDLPAVLEAALVRRITERLGLARRAGQALAGFEKAREWVRSGRARLVIQASDGSEAERARFLSGAAASLDRPRPFAGRGTGTDIRT